MAITARIQTMATAQGNDPEPLEEAGDGEADIPMGLKIPVAGISDLGLVVGGVIELDAGTGVFDGLDAVAD